MATIDFNKALADAKGASFEALPIGDYDVEITKAEAVTSGTGKPMIKCHMKVIAGPHQNRNVLNNFTLSLDNPIAVSIFFRHMKCFGLTDEFFASLGTNGTLEPVAAALLGRRARLTLGIKPWQGEDRNEVKNVKPYTGAPGGNGGVVTAMTGGMPAMQVAPIPAPMPAPVAATPALAPAPAPAPAAAPIPAAQPPAQAPATMTVEQLPVAAEVAAEVVQPTAAQVAPPAYAHPAQPDVPQAPVAPPLPI